MQLFKCINVFNKFEKQVNKTFENKSKNKNSYLVKLREKIVLYNNVPEW